MFGAILDKEIHVACLLFPCYMFDDQNFVRSVHIRET